LFVDFGWAREFADLDRDVELILRSIGPSGSVPAREANLQIQVLHSAFYRNKGAYVIGKAVNGAFEYPFTVPVLHSADGKLYLDTIILDAWRIRVLFSLSRAYFMVDMDVPSSYVQFLRSIMPTSRAQSYTPCWDWASRARPCSFAT
jgi:isocitrate dehydrogenase kinase/phosphatase